MPETMQMLMTVLAHFGTIQALIARGERTPEQITQLISLLEVFLSGEPLQSEQLRSTPVLAKDTKLQTLLSHFADAEFGFSTRVLYAFKTWGIRYVGEVYRIDWSSKPLAVELGAKNAELRADIEACLTAQGLPLELDPTSCWRPPYWQHEEFKASLDIAFVEYGLFGDVQDFSYGGTYLRRHTLSVHHFCSTMPLEILTECNRNLPKGLWAAAYVPPDWEQPTHIPEVWERSFAYLIARETRPQFFFKALERGHFDLFLSTIGECRSSGDSLQPEHILKLKKCGIELMGHLLLCCDADNFVISYGVSRSLVQKALRLLQSVLPSELQITSDAVYLGPTRPMFERMLALRTEGKTKEEIVTQLRAEFPG